MTCLQRGITCACSALVLLVATTTSAHELWIETETAATVGESHEVRVYWGHGGQSSPRAALEGQEDKLTASIQGPDGRQDLALSLDEGCFVGQFTPRAEGTHVVGADLQTGIIRHEVHGIPADTRIIMGATACVQVGEAGGESPPSIGHGLEIVPAFDPQRIAAGDVAAVRVLHRGEPVGGSAVSVKASTSGPWPTPDDARIQSPVWSNEALAHPATGEAAFPIIVDGTHLFCVRYFDESPGVYRGNRNDSSDFSRLRNGDTYRQTMYVATWTVRVSDNSR